MGLIKTGLKAAVAVKVAHMVHDRIERRQQPDWAGGHPGGMAAASSAPASRPAPDTLSQLTQLGELKAAGVLTEEEFQAQKARILGG